MATAGRPLVLTTLAGNFALNRSLGVDQRRDPDGPRKAIGYRLFNLLVHLLTGALLFGVLRRAMREASLPDDWRAIADPLAATVCALWLLHPLQTEVINYIVQRSESLASFFYLAVLYSSQRAWDAAAPARLRWYALAVLCCALGMMSKEIVISAPLAVMLYDRAFRLPTWRSLLSPANGRGWLYIAMWAACLATFAGFELGARGDTAGVVRTSRGTTISTHSAGAIAHYLRLVVWPSPLTIDYGFTPIHGSRGIPGAILLAVLGAVTIAAWTRASRFGWLAFLGSVFFMLLAPSSSVVPIASEVAAERRVYLALAAVLVVMVVGAEWLRRRVARHISPRWLVGAAVVAASALAVTTAVRSRTYTSAEALWRSAVHAVPENPRALGNLGWALLRVPVPKLAEAESVFTKVMAMDSTCHFGCLQYASVLTHAGDFADAVLPLERAVAADPGNVLPERELALVFMKRRRVSARYSGFGAGGRAVPHARSPRGARRRVSARGPARRRHCHVPLRTRTLDGGSEAMQKYSVTLDQAARHPDALPALEQLAWKLSEDW